MPALTTFWCIMVFGKSCHPESWIFCSALRLDKQSQDIDKISKHNKKKWVNDDIVGFNLLDDRNRWSATAMAFWQERVRTATVAQSRTSYSSFVDSSTPENQIAYDLNIDRNLNFIETESADEALESSSAAMTPLIDNNASSSTINNQMPTTSWIIGNINTTNLFPQYRRHVNTIDLFFPLETSLKG